MLILLLYNKYRTVVFLHFDFIMSAIESASVDFELADHLGNSVVVNASTASSIFLWKDGKLQEELFALQTDMVVWVFGKLQATNNKELSLVSSCLYVQVCGKTYLQDSEELMSSQSVPPPYEFEMETSIPTVQYSYYTKRAFIKALNAFQLMVSFTGLVCLNLVKAYEIEYMIVSYLIWVLNLYISTLFLTKTKLKIPEKWPRIGHWQINNFQGQFVGLCGFVRYHKKCIESPNGFPCVYWTNKSNK